MTFNTSTWNDLIRSYYTLGTTDSTLLSNLHGSNYGSYGGYYYMSQHGPGYSPADLADWQRRLQRSFRTLLLEGF